MWFSPSKGSLYFEEVLKLIQEELERRSQETHRLMVGCDSHTRRRTTYVTAIILHRVGKGAIFFYNKKTEKKVYSLSQKIYTEAISSLIVANQIAEHLELEYGSDRIEIHVDMGKQGDTRKLIKEVVGMIVGSGFLCMIKPESIAATWCADRFSKVEGETTSYVQ